jgi:hypothetical protein
VLSFSGRKLTLGSYAVAASRVADAAGAMNDVLTAFRDEGVAAAKNGGGDDVKQSHDMITRVIVRMERAAVRCRVFEGEGNDIVSLIVLTLCPMFKYLEDVRFQLLGYME